MKAKLINSIIIFLLVGVLAGCGEKQDGTKETKQDVESLDFTIPTTILEAKEDIGEGILYYIPNENIEAGFMQNLTSFCGKFLVYGFSDERIEEGDENTEFCLQIISPETGDVVAQKAFSDVELPNVQDCGESLAITDWRNGKVLLLDENLKEISNYQVACEYNSMYVSPDAKMVYVFTPEQGLQITDLTSGELKVTLEDTVNLFASNKCGNVVTFSYTDKKTQLDHFRALNLETGEVIDFPFEGSFYDVNYVNDTWMAAHTDDSNIYYIGNDDEIKTFKYKDGIASVEMCPESGNLLSKFYGESGFLGMTMYDAEGKFVSHCENNLQGAEIQPELVWSEADQGFFFIMADPEGKDRLMFWDISKEVSGTDLVFEELETEKLSEEAVSQELYTKAKAIGYKHGIEIRIAEQMDEDYFDYKVEESLNEEQINSALDILGEELLAYPEGFFDQLLYGSIREIEIHLAGTLTNLEIPEGEINGFASYSGFAQTRGGKAVIVLDVNEGDNLRNFLHHELFHLTDDKLSFDATIRKDAMYSEEAWMELNPEGFEYAGNTFHLPETIYDEEYDLWFIDTYSRTMSKEDRARIMEYAMLGDYNMFLLAPHRQAKLEYLNKCIRDAFDTFGWPEKTVWEETLENSY